ncbi:hypothetical protein TRAPUB_106 [Trametes pubescens]|uniref:F-box domain-containing protein n=1 Tax=Trametes pubescens TaxID=154538 RepID=A0A1M2VN52_TRAPU|nr:hypothetical protein TRAPUB_106 [Trametes pubescens]
MSPTLDVLPGELLYDIVLHFDQDSFKQSLLALSRAIPRSPVPTFLLFEKIHLEHGDQVFKLYRRLRHASEDAARVREFSFESWIVDADIFVNLMALLPSLTSLKMYIGPNFAPEHLEEIFQPPPLSSWPEPALPILSIVQDPLDPDLAPTNFAQPLVFFRLDPLSALAVSPLADHLKQFRLRIPGRQIARHLHTIMHSFPALEFLDLSTSNVGSHDVAGLLGRLRELQILVLDGCPIVSQRVDVQIDAGDPFLQWAELGEALALAGVARATEREKRLRAWADAYYAAENEQEAAEKGKKARRGRKGLATATISLRAPEPERVLQPSRDIPPVRIPKRDQRIRVLPPAPVLDSLATSFPGTLTADVYEEVKEAFERGWAVGIARLQAIRLRHLTSWRNGVSRVVRFADRGSVEWEEEEEYGEEGLIGLVEVTGENAFMLDVVGDDQTLGSAGTGHSCPLLCVAGPERDAAHVDGCGHRAGWNIYKDEI